MAVAIPDPTQEQDNGLRGAGRDGVDEEQRDRARQRERTIDNLKRLYAVVFAISFGIVGQGIYERLKPFLLDTSARERVVSYTEIIVSFEMVIIFELRLEYFTINRRNTLIYGMQCCR
jgi:hypothetical protein